VQTGEILELTEELRSLLDDDLEGCADGKGRPSSRSER
jgi:hypothetical protein